MSRKSWVTLAVVVALAAFVLGLFLRPRLPAAAPAPGKPFAYAELSETDLLSLVATAALSSSGNAETLADLAAEARALVHQLHTYDLEAPPHRTNGWVDFQMAEWPFMAMTYTGLALVELAGKGVVDRDWARTEAAWILAALRRPALSGFMTDHFGEPFPADGEAREAAVFVHGHYLYLALQARNRLGLRPDAEEAFLRRTAGVLLRDYGTETVLRSYPGMYYICDNLPALAALRAYDATFGGERGATVAAALVAAVKALYLDPDSGLIATYVDTAKRLRVSGPRGVGTMYGCLFLPEIDPVFAADIWTAANRHMVRTMGQVVDRQQRGAIGFAPLGVGRLAPLAVCLEHPDVPQLSWAKKNFSDGDSGPVILGVGTSASGFLALAAARNGAPEITASCAELSRRLGGPVRVEDRLYYRNFFHEVGQVVLLYGKALALPGPGADGNGSEDRRGDARAAGRGRSVGGAGIPVRC